MIMSEGGKIKVRTIDKDEPVFGDHLLCPVLVPTVQKRHGQTG